MEFREIGPFVFICQGTNMNRVQDRKVTQKFDERRQVIMEKFQIKKKNYVEPYFPIPPVALRRFRLSPLSTCLCSSPLISPLKRSFPLMAIALRRSRN